jgi:hypothetical protein
MVWVAAWLEYGGQGSNVHARGRGTAATPLAGRRGRFRAARERAACGNGGLGANVRGRPWDRRLQECSGGRARSAGGFARRGHEHDVARGHERLAWHPVEIDLALFNCILLQIFQQKWAQRE